MLTVSALLLALGLALPVAVKAAPIYATSGGTASQLYLIDTVADTATLIGPLGIDRMDAIAFNSSGVLYGVSGGSAGPTSLYTIDPNTASTTLIGAVSGVQGVGALRFNSSGTLYGGAWELGRLITIDPSNGNVLTDVAMTGGLAPIS